MKVYLYFFEDYIALIDKIATEIQRRNPDVEFYGVAARRKTICNILDEASARLNIRHYEWLGDIENGWVSQELDRARLKKYEEMLGTRNLRRLIICDREMGHGYMTGGLYARTRLRVLAEKDQTIRWKYVVGLLDYFFNEFERIRPAYVFLNEVTQPYELAMYMVANHLNIPCIIPKYSRIGDYLLLHDNPYDRITQVERNYQRKLATGELNPGFRDQARDYLLNFRSRPNLPTYSVQQLNRAKQSASVFAMIRTALVDLGKWTAIGLGMFGTGGYIRQRYGYDILKMNLKRWIEVNRVLYTRFFEHFDSFEDEPFIYFPLHLEPESSTMVLSDRLTDQLGLIESIAKSMPVGWRLLVKEHVPAIGGRPKGFYQRIKSIPDVHLISPFAESFRIIRGAKIVITLTGTVGWEAILLGRPLIVFGLAEYLALNEGFVKCDSPSDLDDSIQRALAMKSVDDDRLAAYIESIYEEGVYLPAKYFAYAHYGYRGDEVISQDFARSIVDKIEQRLHRRVHS